MMKVAELYDEMGTSDSHLAHLQQADNEDYEVCVDLPMDAGAGGGIQPIRSIRWDHTDKQMVIEL